MQPVLRENEYIWVDIKTHSKHSIRILWEKNNLTVNTVKVFIQSPSVGVLHFLHIFLFTLYYVNVCKTSVVKWKHTIGLKKKKI